MPAATGISVSPDGRFVVASRNGYALVEPRTGALLALHDTGAILGQPVLRMVAGKELLQVGASGFDSVMTLDPRTLVDSGDLAIRLRPGPVDQLVTRPAQEALIALHQDGAHPAELRRVVGGGETPDAFVFAPGDFIESCRLSPDGGTLLARYRPVAQAPEGPMSVLLLDAHAPWAGVAPTVLTVPGGVVADAADGNRLVLVGPAGARVVDLAAALRGETKLAGAGDIAFAAPLDAIYSEAGVIEGRLVALTTTGPSTVRPQVFDLETGASVLGPPTTLPYRRFYFTLAPGGRRIVCLSDDSGVEQVLSFPFEFVTATLGTQDAPVNVPNATLMYVYPEGDRIAVVTADGHAHLVE